jgi:hypothetical protein
MVVQLLHCSRFLPNIKLQMPASKLQTVLLQHLHRQRRRPLMFNLHGCSHIISVRESLSFGLVCISVRLTYAIFTTRGTASDLSLPGVSAALTKSTRLSTCPHFHATCHTQIRLHPASNVLLSLRKSTRSIT